MQPDKIISFRDRIPSAKFSHYIRRDHCSLYEYSTMGVSKKIIHQILACSPVIFNEFMTGVGYGWITPILVKLTDQNAVMVITVEQISWIASVNEAAKIVGPIVSPLLIDNIGRRNTLVLLTIMYFIVWLSTIFVRNIYLLCAVRALFGSANGINDVVTSIYTTENCSPNFRGIMGGIVALTFFGALFFEYIVASYLSYEATAITNTILAGCVFATFYYGVETPYFLIMKGRRQEAEKSLLWLSGSQNPSEVAEELKKIEHSIAEEKLKKRSLKLLFSSRANVKGIFVVVVMSMLLIARGGNVLGAYASIIFSPSDNMTSNGFTILYGALTFVAVGVSLFFIEKVNRRSLVIGSSVAITVCNTCSYLLMYFHNNGYNIPCYPWLIFGSITSFNMFTALMSPAWYALKGELLPFSVRAIGSSMAIVGFSISSFTVLKTFIPIAERFGMEANLLIYSVISLFMTVFLYFLLPETRGISLHELQSLQNGELVKLNESKDREPEEEYYTH